jgi:PRTRC genetic system protein A
MILPLVNYHILHELPGPPANAALYEYLIAGTGVFLRAEREGLQALIPVVACEIRGLPTLTPYLRLAYPLVDQTLVAEMLDQSRAACIAAGAPREILFHLRWEGRWHLAVPAQDQTAGSVMPLGPAIGSSYETALIEVHSHHRLAPFFSRTDDTDERGFRLYAVLGHIFTKPTLRVRIGIYGYYWSVPAQWVFELPDGVADYLTVKEGSPAAIESEGGAKRPE